MKQRKCKEKQLKDAAEYCLVNNCKRYTALATGLFPLIKDPRTVNKRIVDSSDKVITGEEKQYCKLMTKKEEQSLVRYLLNRNRCRQGVSEKEAEGIVLNILHTRKYLNRRGTAYKKYFFQTKFQMCWRTQ